MVYSENNGIRQLQVLTIGTETEMLGGPLRLESCGDKNIVIYLWIVKVVGACTTIRKRTKIRYSSIVQIQ